MICTKFKIDKKSFFIYFLLFFILFLFTKPFLNQVEFGVYSAYTESIVEDGDYNLTNQMFYPKQKKAVSKTLFYPNFHSHASSVVFAPFYLYGKLISDVFDIRPVSFNPEDNAVDTKGFPKNSINVVNTKKFFKHTAATLAISCITLITLCLMYLYSRELFPNLGKKIILSVLILLFFGTPFVYYSLLEPGNGTMSALLLNLLFVIFYLRIRESNTLYLWLFLGIFHSMAFAIKVDSAFIGLVYLHYIATNIKNINASFIKNVLAFSFGWFFVLFFHAYNNYLILGTNTYGYGETLLINFPTLFDTFFSTYHGVFFNSPIILIAFIIIPFARLKDVKILTDVRFYVGLGIVCKILSFGLTYSHGSGVFGGRQFIPEIPWMAYSIFYFLDQNRNNLKSKILFVLLVVGGLWNLFLIPIYYAQENRAIDLIPMANTFSFYLKTMFSTEYYLKFIPIVFSTDFYPLLKIANFIIPISLITYIKYVLFKRYAQIGTLVTFSFALFFTYSLFTLSNHITHKQNIEQMRLQGYYENALIGSGRVYTVFYENLGSVEDRLLFLRARGRKEEYDKYRRLREDILTKVNEDILNFPMHLDDKVVRNYFREFDIHEKVYE